VAETGKLLTSSALPVGAGVGQVALGVVERGLPHALAGLTKSGRAVKEAEEQAAKRLETRQFGPGEAEQAAKRLIQERFAEQATDPAKQELTRAARGQGAFGGGKLTEQLKAFGESIAKGRAKIGEALARQSSEQARVAEQTDLAAVQQAYVRRLNQYLDTVGTDPLSSGVAAGVGAAEGIEADAVARALAKAAETPKA
jgi:hypothetical protein